MIKNIKELKQQEDILPDKPSVLIYVTLEDVESIEQNPDYIIDMGSWHGLEEQSGDRFICQVCFAGSIMTKTYEPSILLNIDTDNFKSSINDKMHALDDFRQGNINAGLKRLKLKIPKEFNKDIQSEDGFVTRDFEDMVLRDFTEYDENPKQFKKDMLAIADMFDSMGM